MSDWVFDTTKIIIALILVLINGFFVAAEFAIVKIRKKRLEELVENGRPFAVTAHWLVDQMDASLSACQLGITMASLGLGWIGEPAVAHLIRPLFVYAGMKSEFLLHGSAFFIAFAFVTAAHLVIGEQVPKIAALRNPEPALLWSAVPLKIFFYLAYPFLKILSATTSFLLRVTGIEGTSEHEVPHSEEEIRALLEQSRDHGKLSGSEHRMINAAFEFDELICRLVMVPRSDVIFVKVNSSLSDIMDLVKKTKHSRYPVCDGSMDNVMGVLIIKDLIVTASDTTFDLRSIMRPPQFVPETMPARRLLRQFQSTRQHMAFLVDEYGSVQGIVTLGDVLEQLIGPMEDEFDNEKPDIMPDGPSQFIISGSTPIAVINQRFELNLKAEGVDTIAGLLMIKENKLLATGDCVDLSGATAEVLEVKGQRVTRIRLTLSETPPGEN